MQHPILAFYTCTEQTSDKAVERHSQLEGAHCQPRGRKQSPPSCRGCSRDSIWAALQLLALLLHAGAGTVGSSSWHLCVPTLVLLLGAAQHLQRAQTSPPALSKPLWGAARAVKGFSSSLPLCVHPWVAMTEGRVESEPLMFCFSAVAFLNVAGNNPNSSSTELPQQQHLCGNVGTVHQQLFLHQQSLNTTCNEKATGLKVGFRLMSVITFLFIWRHFCYLGKKETQTHPE